LLAGLDNQPSPELRHGKQDGPDRILFIIEGLAFDGLALQGLGCGKGGALEPDW